MKNRILATFLAAALALPFSLQAAEGNYWQQLKERLTQIAPQKKGSATTAVGGVRGSKDQTADTLYWKGEATKAPVSEEEYSRFTAAYQLAVDGKKEDATRSFQSFVKEYPLSPLKEEALMAINTLQKP